MPRNIQVCMVDLMVQIIEDVATLSDETLALILEQFEKVSYFARQLNTRSKIKS